MPQGPEGLIAYPVWADDDQRDITCKILTYSESNLMTAREVSTHDQRHGQLESTLIYPACYV